MISINRAEGGCTMDKDFEDYIAKRCEKALINDKEYQELQKQAINAYRQKDIEKYCECNILLQGVTQKVSYMVALKDAKYIYS